MTQFIDINDMQKLVSHLGVAGFIRELLSYIEHDFKRWEKFDKTPRVANHSEVGVIELMPTSDETLYGFKYVNGHPGNALHNQLTVMSFGALAETATGYPLLLSEFTLATALRTAATSVLAAKYLARQDSKSMAIIGNGAQCEFQIIGFNEILNITDFYLYDIDTQATEKVLRNLDHYPHLNLHVCPSVDDALKHADIITTVTADKAYATILTAAQIQAGVHINAVGGDCPGKTELDANILSAELAEVFVEYTPQTRIEGEIQQLSADFQVTELWQVMNGQASGRKDQNTITIFDSVGFAIEDFSTLRLIYDLAQKHKIGSDIALVPTPDNPRDLYRLLVQPE
ncbi:ornithine cyclodeaminase [Acinetobacter sp.]|jgi:ornithine cyclodeaminase|uniref:ornithine cyclodeaminase n=1 Tax=Acinetobacter sp. TaxID=472 RepID=UPI002818EF62|nr:ornithine cyclodeaminase [Acinetobacter sp.]MDR2250257.1 ornithine cyclodeaminase [Acinetobacter sp.]